ncbi:hypothetical protein Gotur_028448 [Gossypium turneri]
MTTPEYNEWWGRRINDNIPGPSQEDSQSIEEHLRVVPFELEIIKQDFEKRNAELETEKLRKGKNKAEEDLDSLKANYKKLRLSIRTAGLGKTSEQWRQEIQEEKIKANGWEKKFREVQARNGALEKSLSENQKEKCELKDRVAELERSLHQYQSRNFAMELRVSLSKIEEMKERIEELELTLRNCEIRIEYLETNESRQSEQLHYLQNQVENRDRIMGEAVVQIREVADHLQTLAVQADALSVKYELESSRGQELASLLRKIKVLSIRAKPYM